MGGWGGPPNHPFQWVFHQKPSIYWGVPTFFQDAEPQ